MLKIKLINDILILHISITIKLSYKYNVITMNIFVL